MPDTAHHELDSPPWTRIEATLMSTARSIRVGFDDALAALDLNLTSAMLLMFVVEHGGQTQTALAERLDVGRAAAGSIVDRLEERGLVERHADVDDRRVWVVEATDAGKELSVKIAEIDVDVRRKLRTGIDRSERQLLASLLLRMQENLLSDS